MISIERRPLAAIISLAAIILGALLAVVGATAPVASAAPPGVLSDATTEHGWQEAKVVVSGSSPFDAPPVADDKPLELAGGGWSDFVFVAVSGNRGYRSGTTFFTHQGANYSRALCLYNGQVKIGTEVVTLTGSNPAPAYYGTYTISATPSSCQSYQTLVGVLGFFGWGAPGDRFADNYFTVTAYLPGHPDYDSVSDTPGVIKFPGEGSEDPLHLVALEVTQAVQDLDNTVPLVQGRGTMVRAYLGSLDGEERLVTARLHAYANGVELESSPLDPTNPTGGALIDTDALGDRAFPERTLNYDLPHLWTFETEIEFVLESPGGLICLDQWTGNPLCSETVSFTDPMPLDIQYLSIGWEEGGVRVERTWTDLEEQAARVYAQFPVGYDYSYGKRYGYVRLDERPTDLTDVNERLAAAHRVAGAPAEQRWYGVIPGSHETQGGRAAGVVGSGWDGGVVGKYATDHARNRVTHEVGHMLGLHHSVNAEENGYDTAWGFRMYKRGWCAEVGALSAPDFPYWRPGLDPETGTSAALGPMDRVRGEVWGTDLRFFGISPALAVSDPRETTSLMSYCQAENRVSQQRWISARDWVLLLSGDLTPIGGSGTEPAGDGSGTLIRATISPDGTARLAPALPVDEAPTVSDPDGTHEVVLVDDAGSIVHRVSFAPLESQDDVVEGGAGVAPDFIVGVVVPNLESTAAVELWFDGEVLASSAMSASAPIVAVDPPVAGTPEDVRFEWSAEDADGEALRNTVLYSADDGATWSVVAVDVTTSAVDIPRWALPDSDAARVHVITSDGLRTASAISEPFGMPDLAPRIAIDSPEDGVLLAGAQAVVFSASAGDAEDGGAVADSIIWESDLDGYLGSGPSVHLGADRLSQGRHTITATVRDSAGQTASATITVNVQPTGPDVDFLGFEPPVSSTEVNVVKAGRTIPVKFTIGGPDLDAESVRAARFIDDGAKYSLIRSGPTWHLNVQTPAEWAGSVRVLRIELADGSTHDARFEFR